MGYSVKIRQHDISDCGVASLASLAAYYGLKYPLARLRLYSGTTTEGTTIQGILEAANKIGLSASGFKGKIQSLYKIPKPAIIHLKKLNGLLHYVVLYRISGKNVHIMDPAEGKMTRISIDEFSKEWTGYLIIAGPDSNFRKGSVGTSTISRLYSIFTTNLKQYAKALAASLLFILISFSTSLFLKYLIDTVIPTGKNHILTWLSLLMFFLTILSFLLFNFKSRLMLSLSVKTNTELISAYLGKLFALPQIFFDSRKTGEVTSRVDDAFKVGLMLSDVVINLIISIMTLFISFILLFTVSFRLALLVICFTPLYILIYFIYDKINKVMRRKIMEEASQFESTLIEGVRRARSIKHFGIEEYTVEKIRERIFRLNSSLLKAGKWGIALSGISDSSSRMLSLATLWIGGIFIMSGTLTIGELIFFFTITGLFSSPLTSLIGLNASIREGITAADRLFEVMDLDGEVYNEGIVTEIDKSHALILDNISFCYPGREPVIDNLSLELTSGQITALCGESGCGKSTVASMIMRMQKPEKGHITLDGIDINHINLVLWREMATIVPQNPELFSGSLIENIAPGEADPDCSLIIELCRELGLLDFIEKLPSGFDTRLTEGGSSISRGQQQRISIVRALYRKPKILILDEATSSLDRCSEEIIEKAILKEKEHGTMVLMISHNTGNLKIADNIVNM